MLACRGSDWLVKEELVDGRQEENAQYRVRQGFRKVFSFFFFLFSFFFSFFNIVLTWKIMRA